MKELAESFRARFGRTPSRRKPTLPTVPEAAPEPATQAPPPTAPILPNSRSFILGFPRRAAKRAQTIRHLAERGIHAEPFDGFDYEVTGINTNWKYEVDNPGSGFKIGPKLTNLYLTHFLAWKVCSYLHDDTFIFFEDDVRFHTDWHTHVSEALTHLPSDWDMLYFGSCCTANQRGLRQVHGCLYELQRVQCLHAYAVQRKALPAMIEGSARIYAPIDITLITEVRKPLRRFAILPRIADQLDTELVP